MNGESERFWSKVNKEGPTPEACPRLGPCWTWKEYLNPAGYGIFHDATNRKVRAPRYAYAQIKGPIPEGLELDHLCRNRSCVNPGHLDAVTSKENTRRGNGPTARNFRKTHCKRGHLLAGENLAKHRSRKGLEKGHIWRACKTCENLIRNAKRAAIRALRTPPVTGQEGQ